MQDRAILELQNRGWEIFSEREGEYISYLERDGYYVRLAISEGQRYEVNGQYYEADEKELSFDLGSEKWKDADEEYILMGNGSSFMWYTASEPPDAEQAESVLIDIMLEVQPLFRVDE